MSDAEFLVAAPCGIEILLAILLLTFARKSVYKVVACFHSILPRRKYSCVGKRGTKWTWCHLKEIHRFVVRISRKCLVRVIPYE